MANRKRPNSHPNSRPNSRDSQTDRDETDEWTEPQTGLAWNWQIQISEKVLIALITAGASFASGMAYETIRTDARSPLFAAPVDSLPVPQAEPAMCPVADG